VALSDGEIADRIGRMFDLRPASIVRRFGLKNPIFEATASYGHFGNRPYTKAVRFVEGNRDVEREVEFFAWEKLDAVETIKKEFSI
jgi:S-adenosylmethionine synthetase